MSAPNGQPTDDATMLLALALFLSMIVALVSLGPFVLLAGVIVWIVAWLLGSSTIAVMSLTAGIAALFWTFYDSQLVPAIWYGFNTLQQSVTLGDGVGAWLSLVGKRQSALSAIAAGAIGGAALWLWRQDKHNDSPYKKDQDVPPAPIIRIRSRLDRSLPASVPGGTVLGQDQETAERVVLSDEEMNHHALLVGSTGTGKTVTMLNLIEAPILRGEPVIFLDGKGDVETGRRIKAFAEAHGRPAYIFHHGIDGGDEDSCAYSPFAVRDATAITDMVMTLREWNEPHYEIHARGLMQTASKVALALGEPIDLASLGGLMSVNAMIAAVRRHKNSIPNAQALLDEIQDQRAAEQAGVGSLTGIVKNLTRSSLAHLLDTKTGRPVLRLAEAKEVGAVVYVALPALTFPDLSKALGQVFINDIRVTLASSTGPWVVAFDEISTYAGKGLLNLVNQGRSFGAKIVMAGQSFADLERSVNEQGGSFRNQILGSVNTLIVHRLNAPEDAELGAQFAGTYLKPETTAQVVGRQPTGAGSVRVTREFNIGPDKFKELKRGEAVVIAKGKGTVRKIRARYSSIAR